LRRPPFPSGAFYGGLALFTVLSLLFRHTDLDRAVADFFYHGFSPPWPGRHWAWSEAFHRFGEFPADLCGALGLAAFFASFTSPRCRAWRGPGLYLGLLLLLGPGLLSNVLAKGLAGRPRPVETLGYGGIWEFHRPFDFGTPGRGASFLSGHASNAWYFLGLVFLVPVRVRKVTLALALALGAAMCLARVSQGAHWLSDTLLPGAALWSLAAGLSPLMHWQPPASFFRRGAVLLALGGVALGCLSLSRVVYEERHFSGPPAPGATVDPTHRELPYGPHPAPAPQEVEVEVDVDLSLLSGEVSVRFDAPDTAPSSIGAPALPMRLDETFEGQGLPPAREDLKAEILPAGGRFAPSPGALGVRFNQSLRGPWLTRTDHLRLAFDPRSEVDARLRTEDGAINIGPFPAGRRVLLSGLAAGTAPPPGFRAFGGSDWVRDGKPPLISLDLDAPLLRFDQAP
jgi:membrane-associated PAP2 superfamily phosphatase